MRYFIYLSFLGSFFSMYSQNDTIALSKIFSEVKKGYEVLGEYQIEYNYAIYSSGNEVEPKEKYIGLYAHKDGRTYNKIGPIEIIASDAKNIQVNHTDRVLVYHSGAQSKVPNPSDISALINLYNSVEVKKESYGWECILKDPKISASDLSQYTKIKINKDYTLKSMRVQTPYQLVFTEGDQSEVGVPTIETVYRRPTGIKDISIFDIKKYIDFEGSVVKPKAPFTSYEFIKL